jgi:hypothetical protein
MGRISNTKMASAGMYFSITNLSRLNLTKNIMDNTINKKRPSDLTRVARATNAKEE